MKLTELLHIKYPIIQGGMARIARGQLASAVANAGGLGLVGTGGFSPEEFEKELDIAFELTEKDKAFGANIVLMEEDIAEKINIAIAKGVKVVTLAAGNPAPWIQKFLDNNIIVICVVGNSKMAKKAESLGAHAVVIEGMEAGGHIGSVTTMAELPQVVNAVSIPVIAAGGIATGSQILACEIMGASGVQMGTRFLVADETPIHDNFKDALISYEGYQTELIGGGHPVRQLSNTMTKEVNRLSKEGALKEDIEALYKDSLKKAVEDGDTEYGAMMAGLSVGLVKKRSSVKEIFDDLVREYEEARERIVNSDIFKA